MTVGENLLRKLVRIGADGLSQSFQNMSCGADKIFVLWLCPVKCLSLERLTNSQCPRSTVHLRNKRIFIQDQQLKLVKAEANDLNRSNLKVRPRHAFGELAVMQNCICNA